MEDTVSMPPTLGDRLDDRMWALHHDSPEVAVVVGATPKDVADWADDAVAPGPQYHWALAEYLGVDVPEIRRLVLRTQMRIVQRSLHTQGETAAAGF